MSCRRIIRFALIAVAVVTLATPAFADGSEVSRRGACSGRSDWRLVVRREDGGRLRVRFQVDGGAEAQDWHIFLSDNGTRIFSGTRTSSSGGHVEVHAIRADVAGGDRTQQGFRKNARRSPEPGAEMTHFHERDGIGRYTVPCWTA